MIKNKAFICPKCGYDGEEEEDLICSYDADTFDTAVDENNELYDYLTANCGCHKCGHKWTEYFRLMFDGYYSDDVDYNKHGEPTLKD